MDSLTHIVLGAAIWEAVLGKRIGRKAMLIGALADTIPDFDVFASPCFSDAQQLLVHRGITHSFFFILLTAPFFGFFLGKLMKTTEVSWKRYAWLFLLGMLSHILLDSMTAYGTGWFEPFSSYRVAFDSIFVADPFYTLPFLICMLIAFVAKNGSSTRTKWNNIGLWVSCLYLLFTIANKNHVHSIVKESFSKKTNLSVDFVTTPTPLNNFLWMSYGTDKSGYWFGYYSIFDKNRNIEFYHINRKDSLLKSFENNESIKILKQFSKNYYVMSQHDSTIYFNDIRFGQLGGWNGPDSAFVFSFKLNKNSDNSAALSRTKFKTSFSDALASLVIRIKGK